MIRRTQLVVPGSSPGASKLAPLWSYPKSPGDLGAVVATTGTTSSVTARQGEGPPAKCCNWHSRRGRPRSHTPGLRTRRCAHPGRDRPDVNHTDDITGSMGRSVPLSPASLPRVALCFPAENRNEAGVQIGFPNALATVHEEILYRLVGFWIDTLWVNRTN